MRLVALALVAACATDHGALEGRVDELARHQRADAELARRVAELATEVAALEASAAAAEHRLAELTRVQQQALAAPLPPPRPREAMDKTKVWAIAIDGDPVVGAADARVTLVEAMDYACPFCEKLRDTFARLEQRYGKDLRIVYKPFVVHPQVAMTAAVAACAATRQGKFAELDALLWDKGFKERSFEKDPTCWASRCPILDGFAAQAKLDVARFQADLRACAGTVADESRALQVLGVNAIPTSFVNGRVLTGAMPIEQFEQLIDSELKLANERIGKGTKPARYYAEWVLDRGQKTPDASP